MLTVALVEGKLIASQPLISHQSEMPYFPKGTGKWDVQLNVFPKQCYGKFMNRSEILKNVVLHFGYMHMCLYIPFGFKTILSDDTFQYNLIKQDSIETVTISKDPAQIMDHRMKAFQRILLRPVT